MDEFLAEWKDELILREGGKVGGTTSNSRTSTEEELIGENECTESLSKRYCLQVSNEIDDSRPHEVTAPVIGGPSLFVLPAARGGSKFRVRDVSQNSQPIVKPSTPPDSFLDKLILDLNEMNTVPFFDVRLPKEIAILIFNYLSLVDLCHCAMVSHSWKTLAEDNLLWIAICRRMGYNTNIYSISDQVIHWKTVVEELILHRRQVQQNWMERICTVSTYQPVNVGSLCSAVYQNKEVLVCYSTGECQLWSLLSREAILMPPTKTTPTCAAMIEQLGCHGDSSGYLTLFSLDQCHEQNYRHKVDARIHYVTMATNDMHHVIAFASGGTSPFSSLSVLCNQDSELTDWNSTTVRLPSSAQLRNFQIQKVTLVPSLKEYDPFLLLYSTQNHLTLQSPREAFSKGTHFLGEESMCCINCFSSSRNVSVVCGTFDYAYYQVRLFDLVSGVSKENFRGHFGKINCVEFDKSKNATYRIISGGEDKRLNLYDSSSSYPVMRLSGVASAVVCVQLEDWKVVSGSRDGTVAVWDLRIGQELWRTHDRHPVSLCEIDKDYLIVGHIPLVHEVNNGSPLHSRQRGALKSYNFSVDLTDHTKRLPSICSSSYDEPSASFYNLNLLYPYDIIQQ